MKDTFTWREKRLFKKSSKYPIFYDTKKTYLPSGDAHYSMYGITEKSAREYMALNTLRHKLYPHFSSELIIDAETPQAVKEVMDICKAQNWTFSVYETGSLKCGAHFSIPRDAEPSEILYLQDLCLVNEFFSEVKDVDKGIYRPMHLIRGKGKRHETTGLSKKLLFTHIGTMTPTVEGLEISDLLLRQNALLKNGYDDSNNSDWAKFLNAVIRVNPETVQQGGRHSCLWALSKDLLKSGVPRAMALEVANYVNSFFEVPHDSFAVERAIDQAYGADS